ncbi:MAG: sigma-54-dependent Fis family transcriptional regulator, partial [Deltaproteobacteria bacterium]|nr:sigma-54-dependent Fis family transcriptional regulator [Deltaproteobacteria bacterium]
MVVDDEESIRQSLSDVLKDEGFDVILAGDGQEALKMLNSNMPDLVILDIWMPVMDGTEVLKEIKKSQPELEVIMISGHGNIEAAVKAIKLGAYDYIEKPLSLEGVLLTVRRALTEGGKVISNFQFPISNLKSQIPNHKFEAKKGRAGRMQRTIKKGIVMGG